MWKWWSPCLEDLSLGSVLPTHSIVMEHVKGKGMVLLLAYPPEGQKRYLSSCSHFQTFFLQVLFALEGNPHLMCPSHSLENALKFVV